MDGSLINNFPSLNSPKSTLSKACEKFKCFQFAGICEEKVGYTQTRNTHIHRYTPLQISAFKSGNEKNYEKIICINDKNLVRNNTATSQVSTQTQTAFLCHNGHLNPLLTINPNQLLRFSYHSPEFLSLTMYGFRRQYISLTARIEFSKAPQYILCIQLCLA